MKENSLYDKKSLKEITGKSADWNEVAKDCVAFSIAQGGIIDYGIEDDAEEPMPNQRVPEELVVTLQNKINQSTARAEMHEPFCVVCYNTSKKIRPLLRTEFSLGAGSRTRTDDLRITNALLYQLSHTSNLRKLL